MSWSAWIAIAIAVLEVIGLNEKRGAPDVFGCSSLYKGVRNFLYPILW